MQPGNGERRPTFVEEARRRQIVVAAAETIAEEGYPRASFARIARRASISPGLITYHFGTKEHLMEAVLEHVGSRLDRAMEGGPEPLEGFEDGLRRIVGGHVRHSARHPEEMAVREEITRADLPEGLRARVEQGQADGRAELVDFLTEGQRHGEFRAFDPEVFTDALFAAMRTAPQRLRGRDETECAAYADELADLFAAAATGRTPESNE